MKTIKFLSILLALLAFTACSSDDDDKKVDELTVQKLAGLWVFDYAEDKTEGDLHWTRCVEEYLFRADGTGYYECFLLDGENYAGAEYARGEGGGDFHYTISGNKINGIDDETGLKWTLTYADGKFVDDDLFSFQKATTAQQTLVEQLYGEWQKANSGTKDDGSTIKTDVTDSYTDEPARAPKRDVLMIQ